MNFVNLGKGVSKSQKRLHPDEEEEEVQVSRWGLLYHGVDEAIEPSTKASKVFNSSSAFV